MSWYQGSESEDPSFPSRAVISNHRAWIAAHEQIWSVSAPTKKGRVLPFRFQGLYQIGNPLRDEKSQASERGVDDWHKIDNDMASAFGDNLDAIAGQFANLCWFCGATLPLFCVLLNSQGVLGTYFSHIVSLSVNTTPPSRGAILQLLAPLTPRYHRAAKGYEANYVGNCPNENGLGGSFDSGAGVGRPRRVKSTVQAPDRAHPHTSRLLQKLATPVTDGMGMLVLTVVRRQRPPPGNVMRAPSQLD
ncbi:uncharacterized protein CLUP02_14991 [Colletotrichum lupini]|uniref:Uncharacterized protein n=1 Tax=Colletotrichum lupini TaxID=145971 RepID=A0A9Q8T5M9_9PEZI|nr:uncharacterized protein CLUP02_14991 [Colletotrichum lupini]UQC89460.1 hypothetical protein CLUP02_14991 [Colletotrichum lupini]